MRRLVLIATIWLAAVSLLQPLHAFADPADSALSQDNLTIISRTCVAAQGQLARVQINDKLVRINRGGSYSSLLKLMNSFNSRAASNNYDVSSLVPLSSSLSDKYQQFVGDFTKYDNSMDNVVQMNCQNQPAVFYSALTQTRGLRVQLAGDIKDMDQVVDQYQQSVVQFRATVVSHEGSSQ